MNDNITPEQVVETENPSSSESVLDAVLDKAQAELTAQAPAAPATADASAAEAAESNNAFAALGLMPELLQAIEDLGYTQPTGVQAAVLPQTLNPEHRPDLMVSSQTGSGKTAAFLLPMLQALELARREQDRAESQAWQEKLRAAEADGLPPPKKPKRKNPINPRNFQAAEPLALVLCPTRELAQQVASDAINLVKYIRGVRVASIIGGLPYATQIARLQNAALVVATPGRLLDLERSGQIKLGQVQTLVLDEADRMLDLGFADELEAVHNLCAERQQTLMFSATFAPRIQSLAAKLMHTPERVQIDTPQEAHANISQTLYWADNSQHRRNLLDHLLRDTAIEQAIVFASTQIECDSLAHDLAEAGFSAAALHGALSQGLRNRRLKMLREGRIQFLVATDVAARGIDVASISHVFNYGLPMKAEDYVHRIGRTGRAGRDGLALTIAEHRDRHRIRDIEFFTKQVLNTAIVPGMEPKAWPQPKKSAPKRSKPKFGPKFSDRFERQPRGEGFAGAGHRKGGFAPDFSQDFGGGREFERRPRFNEGQGGGFAGRGERDFGRDRDFGGAGGGREFERRPRFNEGQGGAGRREGGQGGGFAARGEREFGRERDFGGGREFERRPRFNEGQGGAGRREGGQSAGFAGGRDRDFGREFERKSSGFGGKKPGFKGAGFKSGPSKSGAPKRKSAY